jgi:hypothetical protein
MHLFTTKGGVWLPNESKRSWVSNVRFCFSQTLLSKDCILASTQVIKIHLTDSDPVPGGLVHKLCRSARLKHMSSLECSKCCHELCHFNSSNVD